MSAPTAAEVRARLAGTRLPEDPRRVALPPGFERWPPELRARVDQGLHPAGVLVPLVDRPQGLTVLLTRRAAHLRYHPGQVAFPGGRLEPGDPDVRAAALREAHEEVGIAPSEVEIAGYLEPVLSVTGYAVTPVVGLVAPGVELVIDPGEVQHAFEVPLAFLLDARNARQSARELHGVRVPIVEFEYAHERIWGLTAHILMILRSRIMGNNPL